MKTIVKTLIVAMALVGLNAQAKTYGNYTPKEKAELTRIFDEMPLIIAEGKILKAERNYEGVKIKVQQGEDLYRQACAIYKKDPRDFVRAGCHEK
jgi:hypothetical protein